MILENIREATSGQHRQLESSELLLHLSNKTITHPLYIEVLNRFYGCFHPLERTLNPFSEISTYLPDLHERRKSSTLAADIKAIHGIFHEPPICSELPEVDTAGKAFGCLYVMERSTPGGKIISQILKEKLGLDHNTGASIFIGYGPDTGSKWKTFRESLTLFSTQYNNDPDIITGAADTFSRLHQWMKN
jgi:heme oxygenase